jgi:hypothetical protein
MMPRSWGFSTDSNPKMEEKMGKDVREIAARIKELAVEAQTAYGHEVDALINKKCRDPERIEYLLDGLLDFCFDPIMLGLYKRLCRYYFDIDPEATVAYFDFVKLVDIVVGICSIIFFWQRA